MLGSRLLVSAILIPAFVGLCFVDHLLGTSAWVLLGLCLFLTVRSAYEFVELLSVRNFRASFPAISGLSVLLVVSVWLGRYFSSPGTGWKSLPGLSLPMLVYAVSVLALMLREASRYREPGHSMESLGANLLGVSYIGVLLVLTAQLRWVAGAQAGYFTLASLVICVKLGDIGAYSFGRLWGKKKMCPVLSPGKTWMGAVGALVGGMLGAVLWLKFGIRLFSDTWTPPAIHWCLLYGVILAVVGLVGDLCESLIKRDVEKKDAARLMPGFGGLLDLLDSIIFAGPVAYLLWMALPLAAGIEPH
jgi:phosphatidate cytidylyltransferase